ncbi:MAG: hypothetical protein AAFV53_34870, partial [Myxococcota bacterium]
MTRPLTPILMTSAFALAFSGLAGCDDPSTPAPDAPSNSEDTPEALVSIAGGDSYVPPAGDAKPNDFWWPDTLDLSPLRQNASVTDPNGPDFDYAAAFATVDLDALKADIEKVLTTSQDWWPADYG